MTSSCWPPAPAGGKSTPLPRRSTPPSTPRGIGVSASKATRPAAGSCRITAMSWSTCSTRTPANITRWRTSGPTPSGWTGSATSIMTLLQRLQRKFHEALQGFVDDPAPFAAMVRPAQDARFGDYQANCAMPLAKVLGKPPRAVAEGIKQRLHLDDLLEPPEVAGPGFINLRLRNDWLAPQPQRMAHDEPRGDERAQPARTLVIDFSSPNVAKPMHVGHLRSTIIGDSLARLFRFLGHRVITDNHLGDWGTQFGILLYGYKHFRDEEALRADPVKEMVRLYIQVRNLMKAGEDEEDDEAANPVAEAARQE